MTLPSTALPSYPQVRLALTGVRRLAATLDDFGPDVVHLASPFLLGWQGVCAAEHLGVPSVAIYQTDVPAYAERYGIAAATPALTRHLAKLHQRATLTLAPSTAALGRMQALGVDRLALWRRGIDTARFHPSRRDEAWRARLAPGGEVLVGYVGRLAPEKQVEDLRALAGVPGIRVVIVGDGPSRVELERLLPDAAFTGFLDGDELARAMASLDVFVHTGESETFCQTVQEAFASGVPVVATGAGGPVDLVRSSVDGWLYRPGDLADLAARVADLAGDASKRRAFGAAAHAVVQGRGWDALGDELLGHYSSVIRTASGAGIRDSSARASARSESAVPVAKRIRRYVAVGDSLTEGLSDESRMPPGEVRGWADRLALLLAAGRRRTEPLQYANLAVRSRRIDDVIDVQLPRARELGADFVSVFIGANDLVQFGARPSRLAARLGTAVQALRSNGIEVLLVTPIVPDRPGTANLRRKFGEFNVQLRELAAASGCHLLDLELERELTRRHHWGDDRVHLNSAGHRAVAYAAARELGVPDTEVLADLEAALHDGADSPRLPVGTTAWLLHHVAPWVWRRARRRVAGDGRFAKHDALVSVLVSHPAAVHPPLLG